jgi:hypothetical protein
MFVSAVFLRVMNVEDAPVIVLIIPGLIEKLVNMVIVETDVRLLLNVRRDMSFLVQAIIAVVILK